MKGLSKVEFKYKVSVVIPVYNSEIFISNTLESLLNQIFPLDDMEVLMIDDGSTDQSASICRTYADKCSSFKLFQKENGGVSSARNMGIKYANGKYIMFLDADDTYSSETIKNVYAFFEKHYHEVDVVTFFLERYKLPEMQKLPPHMRYTVLNHTAVFDLNRRDNIYIAQTTMNICIKNRMETNLFFDEKLKSAEDQKFVTSNLMGKMKIGYCHEAKYNYFRHGSSVTSERLFPHISFDSETAFYEWLFAQYEGSIIPKYIQALVFYNMTWKNTSNLLYPWHLEGGEYDSAFKRIVKLLNKIDTDVIVNYPAINNFHKHYFLSLKENNTIYPFASKKGVFLIDSDNSSVAYYCRRIELVIQKICVRAGKLEILGHIKSPLFNYMEKPILVAYENGEKVPRDIELSLSGFSYYKCKTKTNNFWKFCYKTEVDVEKRIEFFVDIDGIECVTRLNPRERTPFFENRRERYVVAKTGIALDDNQLIAAPVDEAEFWQERACIDKEYVKNTRVYNHRISCRKYAGRRIWLYTDCYTVDYDNGYYQFINDWQKDDGVERYYVVTNDFDNLRDHFDVGMANQLVSFGSIQHKDLYLNAEKIITSYAEHSCVNPFVGDDEIEYADIFNAEVIYLQHGILHATLPWYYSPEKIMADKIVISSPFEKENLSHKYGWREEQLIESGMPRYDYIDRNITEKSRIIFAPSWRNYLVGALEVSETQLSRKSDESKLEASNYYKNIMAFINNPKLHTLLEENDLCLDVKLHPNFYQPYKDSFVLNSSRVNVTDNKVNLGDYKMFLTDFSSFVFDYAYLCRPIHYFVPDYNEFKAGMNHYRELDLPYDKAFGSLSTTPEEAVDAIARVIENDFVAQEPFKQRMENFFYPLNNCCETLYQALISDKTGDVTEGGQQDV